MPKKLLKYSYTGTSAWLIDRGIKTKLERICIMKKLLLLALVLILCLSGCGKTDDTPLDKNDPVTITIWHYYNGSQQTAFNSLVEEFNETIGKEKGIYVQSFSKGSVSELEAAVRDSMAGKVGADNMPDIFSSYADTAYEVEQSGALADLSEYLSDEEISKYVDSYIEEGRIATDGTLRIFPVAKSTEIMMINKTDWEKFSNATGAKLEDLNTIEGIVSVSQMYYEWTDSLTPDIANDGKAFYGRDAMANYFIISMRQLGKEIFEVKNGEVTLNIDKEDIRRIWDNYYVPMIKGYFCAYGSFRSDDIKTGDLLAYTGATTSAMYFPDKVELEDESYEIDYIIMNAPILEGGENYALQQGAGMVVSKTDRKHEYASVEFLKWFTEEENNLRFGSTSGYLPVLKNSNSAESFKKVIEDYNLEVNNKTYDCVLHILNNIDSITLYTNKSFKNGTGARKILEYNLSDKAVEDRANVEAELSQGKTLEEACAVYISDEAFEEWYIQFCDTLEQVISE